MMRSTTPPLYYKPPEGAPLPYYTARDVSLRLAQPVPPQPVLSVPVSALERAATPRSSSAFPPAPPASSPFVPSAAESMLDAEEQSLRGQLAALHAARERDGGELLGLSHAWAALLEREERYHTEPMPDLTDAMQTRAARVGALRDAAQHAEAQHAALHHALKETDPLVETCRALAEEAARLMQSAAAVERRRALCKARAERLFDAETKRAATAARVGRQLEAQMRAMRLSAPLAEETARSRSTSRGVTFAQKSIVLDIGAEEETPNNETGGVSLSLECGEEEEEGGIGGESAAFSLNAIKRARVEVPTA